MDLLCVNGLFAPGFSSLLSQCVSCSLSAVWELLSSTVACDVEKPTAGIEKAAEEEESRKRCT